MKLRQTLKNLLPVSRATYNAEMAKARHAALTAEVDNSYLLNQLKQAAATNVRLEAKLAHGNAPEEV